MNGIDIPSDLTLLTAIKWASGQLEGGLNSNPRLDSEIILAQVVGLNRINLYINFDQPLTSSEIQSFSDLIKRRILGEPVQYLNGFTEFYGRSFKISPDVLIPRPETEILIDHVKAFLVKKVNNSPENPAIQVDLFNPGPLQTENPVTIVDIGTGSGIIALTLFSELSNLRCYATDVSAAALLIAQENAIALDIYDRITFMQGPFMGPLESILENDCDLIISNPPYIVRSEISQLPIEIREFEPLVALDGGEDGLECYTEMIEVAPRFLKTGGMLAFEIGADQAEDIISLLNKNSLYINIEVIKDYNHLNRVVSAIFSG